MPNGKKSPYDVLRDENATMGQRMLAHEELLRFGAPGCGDSARQIMMAEAIGDMCLCIAAITTKLKNS